MEEQTVHHTVSQQAGVLAFAEQYVAGTPVAETVPAVALFTAASCQLPAVYWLFIRTMVVAKPPTQK